MSSSAAAALGPEAAQKLLFGSMETIWAQRCRVWVDDARHRYAVSSDEAAVAAFTDEQVTPFVDLARKIFGIVGFDDVTVIGLPTPRFSAVAGWVDGQRVVAIHEGLLVLLRLWMAQELLVESLSESGLPEVHAKQRAVVQTAQGMGIRFLRAPFRWGSVSRLFPPTLRPRMLEVTVAALAFVVGHELAHHRAGHTEFALAGWGSSPFDGVHLLLSEQIRHAKDQEFEADAEAVRLATRERQAYIAAARLFLSHMAVAEAIRGRDAATHPFALNRLAAIRQRLPPDLPLGFEDIFGGLEELASIHQSGSQFVDRADDEWGDSPAQAAERLEAMTMSLFGTVYKEDLTRDLLFDSCWASGPDIAQAMASQLSQLSSDQVLCTNIATAVAIAERHDFYLQLGHRGDALRLVEQERTAVSGRGVVGQVPDSLHAYIQRRMALDHPGAHPVADAFVAEIIERTHRYLRW